MRLLVVEDDVKMASLLKRGLEREGYVVEVAASGEDALWAGREFPYDAVVLDAMIPAPDGFEVCRQLREAGKWMPVIMLTAFGQERLPVAALQAGALDYFRKDQVNSSLLGKAIQQAIEKARLQANAAADAARLRELEETVARLQQQLKA